MVAVVRRSRRPRMMEDRSPPASRPSPAVRRSANRGRCAGQAASKGSRLVPYVAGPKRGPNGSRNRLLSCANTIEAQGYLDGRIHPNTASHPAA
jgi:hypothetical protein